MARAKRRSSGKSPGGSPRDRLIELIDDATTVAATARRHRKSLDGANFYANKMATLRADGTIAFGKLPGRSVGDTSALAELMQTVFSVDSDARDRLQAARDLKFALKTTWANVPVDQSRLEDSGIFPLVTLNQTNRGYLIAVGRQANGCYTAGWYDSCAVMMRRLLESSIIEAFEAKKLDQKIKDARSGDFLQLTPLISAAVAETAWNLPRNVKTGLPRLRDMGHRSAHSRYYVATKPDIDPLIDVYRETIETFLHIAGLISRA